VLHENRRGAARVAACSAEARALGIAIGMSLAEARMLGASRRMRATRQSFPRSKHHGAFHTSGELQLAPYDPAADREALQRLAEWSQRFSPLVGLEDGPTPSSLFADLTGLEPLFGSESNLAAQVIRDFTHRGLTVRVAIADTLGAAWALAHFAESPKTTTASSQLAISTFPFAIFNSPPGQHFAVLRSLPIEALRLSDGLVDLLHQLGIYRISQLEPLPRKDLTVRFGPELLRRLDQAMGRLAEPLPAQPLPVELEIEQSLEYPTTQRATIETLLEHVIQKLTKRLLRIGRGVGQLECRLRCEASQEVDLSIGLFRPTASARHVFQLVGMRLERVTLPAAVSAAYVRAAVTAPLARLQQELFSDFPLQESPRHLADLVDRLSSRLGRRAVVGVRLLADAQPELTYQYVSLVDESGKHLRRNSAWHTDRPDLPPRPLRLMRRPVPLKTASHPSDGPPPRFHWLHTEHRVAHAWGPERIETGWWRGCPVSRDYWRIETSTGTRLWLFRRLRDEQWFIQGTFE